MRLFHRLLLSALVFALSVSAVAGRKDDKAGDKKPRPEPLPAGATPDPKASARISLPLVKDHDSLGVIFPSYDTSGMLQMNFTIGVASKLDDDHVKMSDTKVDTYNEEGEPEMSIELPVSVLDLATKVITSDTKTTIRREDFTVSGDSVVFNTATKQGSLVGHVHMTIYNVKSMLEPDEETPPKGAGKNEAP